jgi:hypothetical protein
MQFCGRQANLNSGVCDISMDDGIRGEHDLLSTRGIQ